MRANLQVTSIVPLLIFAVGCGDEGDSAVNCNGIGAYGIAVEIRDLRTNLPAAQGAKGSLEDGDYREDMLVVVESTADSTLVVQGALERVGIYRVSIVKARYKEWVADSVVVQKNGCNVETVWLDAFLEPVAFSDTL